MTPSPHVTPPPGAGRRAGRKRGGAASDVLVFVEEPGVSEASIRHAQTVAQAYGGKVVLVHVQCRPGADTAPIDPIEWDMQKQQALKWLGRLSRSSERPDAPCETTLLEGRCISQIRGFLKRRQGDIAATVRCRSSENWQASETVSGVLLSHSAGVLVIPEDGEATRRSAYRRILVPLDGSPRAETALPKAVMLALAQGAELMLCYVVPEPGLTKFGVRDKEAERLREMVRSRNAQAGKIYLSRIRNSLAPNGLNISTRIANSGDARRALLDLMAQEQVDFVVMATHGQSGHSDVPTGDVARFILDRADIPVLLVRHLSMDVGKHAFDAVASEGVRQPAGTGV